LVPGDTSAADLGAFAALDKGDVATAYLAHSSRVMAGIATVLGFAGAARRYGELADRATEAWRVEYLGADGSLTPDTQANHVRALAFDLVPEPARAAVAARLVALVREAGTHLGTGFLATPDLLPVLADGGHVEVAYELLRQDTAPSWLAMIDRGATTMWEHWDGVGADGVAHDSLNHYSKGAVISFLHRYTAGIRLLDDAVGYRRFRVQPQPGGGLTWVHAVHESPYGRIEVRWELAGDEMSLVVTVPAGSSAEVVLPDGTTTEVGPGTHTHVSAMPRRTEDLTLTR
jgi:alpha-L-rhamnosidase